MQEGRGKREEGRGKRKDGKRIFIYLYYLAASPAVPIEVIAGEQSHRLTGDDTRGHQTDHTKVRLGRFAFSTW